MFSLLSFNLLSLNLHSLFHSFCASLCEPQLFQAMKLMLVGLQSTTLTSLPASCTPQICLFCVVNLIMSASVFAVIVSVCVCYLLALQMHTALFSILLTYYLLSDLIQYAFSVVAPLLYALVPSVLGLPTVQEVLLIMKVSTAFLQHLLPIKLALSEVFPVRQP